MRIIGPVLLVSLAVLAAGCGTPESEAAATRTTAGGTHVFLTVDFQEGQTLRYKFTSAKKIAIDWDPNAAAAANRVQEQVEDFEMIVAYTPVAVDPYGASTIRATVESVQAVRSGGRASRNSADAVETAQGKSFTLQVDPRGRITEAAELTALIQEMGQRAFRTDTSAGRVKEPDMIWDFIASQWFLWDAVSTVERPAAGVAVGQTWSSRLSVPTPMVTRLARNVVYTLAEVRPGEAGPRVVIKSAYTLADAVPAGWPIPYSGRFQMSGTFGFLVSYEVQGLEGSGEELFDLQAGRVERRQEKYTVRMKAGLPPLGIQAHPQITIDQTLTMERQ